MLMSATSKACICKATTDLLQDSYLVQAPEKRSWLGLAVADAVQHVNNHEINNFCKAGEGENDDRVRMRRRIRARVMEQNEICGFIILPIILAAILTWIIKRILDRWFNGEFNG